MCKICVTNKYNHHLPATTTTRGPVKNFHKINLLSDKMCDQVVKLRRSSELQEALAKIKELEITVDRLETKLKITERNRKRDQVENQENETSTQSMRILTAR